jgi:DNA-binding response OmpR family regulator
VPRLNRLAGFHLAGLLGALFAVPLAGVLWVLLGAAYAMWSSSHARTARSFPFHSSADPRGGQHPTGCPEYSAGEGWHSRPTLCGLVPDAMTLPHVATHQATHWPPRGPARVLLVLDRLPLVELIKMTLNHGIYTVRTATLVDEVTTIVTDWQPHLALLDMDLDGAQIMAQVAAKPVGGLRLPVIGLTRRGDLKTKLAAFEAGVDDILTIPFAPEELLARVIALVRRAYSDAVTFTPVIKLGELEIDILKRTVRAGTSELHLTSLEQSLLYFLAANAGRIVSREEILDTLWGVDYVAESNVVDRQVRNLRARLQNDWRQPRFIATVPGRGYRFLPTFTGAAQAS